jgi:transcriptional regulator with XRE-family HTH domain
MARKKKSKLIHPPYSKFMGYMKENGIKLQELADVVGSTMPTVSRKNNGYADYSMDEVNKICDYYGISMDFFRTNKVS